MPAHSIWSRLLPAVSLAVCLLLPTPVRGQARAGVSPTDSAAVLIEAARSFEGREEWNVAEALYRHILRRFPDTPAALSARERLDLMDRSAPGTGSVELQVWGTLYGLWLGVAVPGAFGADDSEPYGLGLLLGGPAGFLSGRAAARSADYSLGQVRAITLGGTWGTWQGYGWREVLDLGVTEVCPPMEDFCYAEEDTGEETFAAMVLGGLAGLTTGAIIARNPVSSATATGANFGSLWGSWFGTAAGVLADLEDDDLLAAALVGGNAGLVGAALATPKLGWSRDRWRLVSVAGVLGGLGGLGIDLLAQPDDDKVLVAIPLAASLVGLGIGIAASRGLQDRSGAEPLDGALLSLRNGSVALDPPVPFPTLRPVDGPRGTEWRTALGVTLFRATFQ